VQIAIEAASHIDEAVASIANLKENSPYVRLESGSKTRNFIKGDGFGTQALHLDVDSVNSIFVTIPNNNDLAITIDSAGLTPPRR